MAEEGNDIIVLNRNPRNLEENNEIPEKQNENIDYQTQKATVTIPVQTTLLKVNTTIANFVPLNLNNKDIIFLPPEIKEKLGISPCPICQSQNYSLYIPEKFSEEDNNQAQQNQAQNENLNINSEMRTIRENNKYKIYFPVLICESNHQRCLVCNLPPHESYFCEEQYLNYNYIYTLYDTIKVIIPEQKKDDFDFLFNLFTNKEKESAQSSGESCCNGKCFWTNTLFIFLLFLWTVCSAVIFSVGVGFCALSLALRVACCLYHFCYQTFCTTTVHEEDRGNYILRVTTHHVDREIADQIQQERDDKNLAECGAVSLFVVITFIPVGYRKIFDWYDDWKRD